jgi:hypothetical protein
MAEFSDAQVIGAIGAAVRAGDMQAVAGLMHVLAVQNPREARLLLDAIELLPAGGVVTNREELARVLYEAPFGTLPLSNWPPSHPDDREWWLTRADAVLAAGWRRE